MNEHVERFTEMEWQQVSDVARQKLIDNGEKRVRLLELSAGFQEQEWCQRGHTGYVISGVLDVEFSDSAQTYSDGELFMVSTGQPHKARVISGKVELFLVDDV